MKWKSKGKDTINIYKIVHTRTYQRSLIQLCNGKLLNGIHRHKIVRQTSCNNNKSHFANLWRNQSESFIKSLNSDNCVNTNRIMFSSKTCFEGSDDRSIRLKTMLFQGDWTSFNLCIFRYCWFVYWFVSKPHFGQRILSYGVLTVDVSNITDNITDNANLRFLSKTWFIFSKKSYYSLCLFIPRPNCLGL